MSLLRKSLDSITARSSDRPAAPDATAPGVAPLASVPSHASASGSTGSHEPDDPDSLSDTTKADETVKAPTVSPATADIEPKLTATLAPPENVPALDLANFESPLHRLEALRKLLSSAVENSPIERSTVETSPAPPPLVASPPSLAPQPQLEVPQPVQAPPPLTVILQPARPPLCIAESYRELRDHLLARFAFETSATLALIDAGQVTNDVAWVVPLAASLVDALAKPSRGAPSLLLVEAAGPHAGIAQHLGIGPARGLSEVVRGTADWSEVIQPTQHPQVDFISRGQNPLDPGSGKRLSALWPELKTRYDAILVAAGPIAHEPSAGTAAELCLAVSDGALLFVELNATSRVVADDTRQALDDRGVKLLGCVVRGGEDR